MEATERHRRRQRRHGDGARAWLPFAVACLGVLLATTGCTPDPVSRSRVDAGAAEAGSAPPAEAPSERSTGDDPATLAIRPGVEVLLSDSIVVIAAKRFGLITNQTGVDSKRASTIDLLFETGGLVALFSPEHGIRGVAEAGEIVDDAVDVRTGLPIHSLYGATREPMPGMLEGLDLLLFDIQDIGARYYTYASTMSLAMAVAGRAGVPFVVLDRPNPIGGDLVQGTVLDEGHASFVGLHPVPMRHGMTPGELARLIVGEFGVAVDLRVIPAAGWRREMWLDETGLPWIPPSPNMPSLESAAHYPGTCLFEGTNLSVGRGTDRAFQQIGAPWLDADALAERLTGYGLPGVRFESATFTPEAPGDAKFDGDAVAGVRFVVTDRDAYDPASAAVAALLETRRLSGTNWEWRLEHFDRLAGTDLLRRQIERGVPLEEIVSGWSVRLRQFERLREAYLLY